MFGAKAEADYAGREPPQKRHPPQQPDRQRRRHLCGACQHASDHSILQDQLEPLRCARRKLAAALNGFEIPLRNRTLEKPRGENVRGGDRVLDREVDPDATDRRHRMSGVADAQKPGPVPRAQAIHRYAQQLDIGPIPQLVDPVPQVGSEARDLLTQRRQTTSMDLVEPAFGDHVGALPVIFAVEHHKDAAGVDPPEGLPWILRTA